MVSDPLPDQADSRGAIRSLRLFATEPAAPRSRRPTDWILLVVGLFLLLVSGWSVEPPGSLRNDITRRRQQLPPVTGSES